MPTRRTTVPTLTQLRRKIAVVDEEIVRALLQRSLLGKPPDAHDIRPVEDSHPAQTSAELAALARHDYARLALPALCEEVEENPEASEEADKRVIHAVTERLSLMTLVAAAKARSRSVAIHNLRATGNAAALEKAITDAVVESHVVTRAAARAALLRQPGTPMDLPVRVAAVFREWIIPMARRLQVQTLLATPLRRKRIRRPKIGAA